MADHGAGKVEQSHLRKEKFNGPLWPLWWYLEWAIPGLGMFSEAYIIFSAGQIAPFQQAMWPTCYIYYTDCDIQMIQHLAGYIQICGIMAGMLLWGVLGDYTGRKWGSRCVAMIMLSGCILLTFTPFAKTPYGYFAYFMTAQTWYGFGVGGEYPMASASAAERSATTPELRHLRAQQVILVFSNQGMGNLTNACVILICMAIFGQTGQASVVTSNPTNGALSTATTLDPAASANILKLTYGFGAVACLVMVTYRLIFLQESEMFAEEKHIENTLSVQAVGFRKHVVSLYYYWPRQLVASGAWIANDFAFYGNKLQQNVFLGILFPTASPYLKQQWNVLNSFIALLGYYTAAGLCDKTWYGRVRCQNVGFAAMFIFYIIIYAQWGNMAVPCGTSYTPNAITPAKGTAAKPANQYPGGPYNCASNSGAQAFQALYYLSSYFNQFGPNATTWLVAGEIFPTDIRATYHGFAACMGKLGAIISALWISYIDSKNLSGWSQDGDPTYNKPGGVRMVFLISAIWAIGGMVLTWIFLPDTTGLDLEEYDRLQRCVLEGRFQDYHGEGVNPRHLSLWEIYVLGWHKQYNPEQDRVQFETELKEYALTNKAGAEQMKRMSVMEDVKKTSNVDAMLEEAKVANV